MQQTKLKQKDNRASMNLAEIKKAIAEGKKVCWSNSLYDVIKKSNGDYMINCNSNNHCIGLTHTDNKTLNGEEEDFFIKGEKYA